MQTTPCLLLLALVALDASAIETFASRVERAKGVEHSRAGKAYQEKLMRSAGQGMAHVMKECFPKTASPDILRFTLVADVQADRTLSNIAVVPSTPMTRCFMSGFAALSFPKPSSKFKTTGMPIVIEMAITRDAL